MSLWLIGFIAALIVVLLVAALLIGILVEARRIRSLALAASNLVQEIDANTRIVWALRDTNAVAGALLGGAAAIDANAAAIVAAVSGAHDEQSAAR
ncbi:MAG: hypothetical protein H0W65_08275 [Sphingomonas sp.]|uniref:hypothetical protein n=1 Tax=Sphingomonas sp. TaxID=28214 RepID=UPI00178D29DA|nr:hypothetical protein [Sphingomonas sp.]MBA3667704.1 hypothetical protein [Sphingomonas sp.]